MTCEQRNGGSSADTAAGCLCFALGDVLETHTLLLAGLLAVAGLLDLHAERGIRQQDASRGTSQHSGPCVHGLGGIMGVFQRGRVACVSTDQGQLPATGHGQALPAATSHLCD